MPSGGQLVENAVKDAFHDDRGEAPFVHHLAGAVAGAAARAVEGDQIHLRLGSQPEDMLQTSGSKPAILKYTLVMPMSRSCAMRPIR